MDNSRDIQNVLGGIAITSNSNNSTTWSTSRYSDASPFPKYNTAEITGGDTDEEDDIVSSRSIKVADIISIWLLIVNPITNKYEWIRQSQCEPQVNKKLE